MAAKLVSCYVLSVVFGVCLADVCRTNTSEYEGQRETYCTHGCCGNYPNEYCCTEPVSTFNGWATLLIVVFVVGGITLISVSIAVMWKCYRTPRYPGIIISRQGQEIATLTTESMYPTLACQQHLLWQNSQYFTLNIESKPPVYQEAAIDASTQPAMNDALNSWAP